MPIAIEARPAPARDPRAEAPAEPGLRAAAPRRAGDSRARRPGEREQLFFATRLALLLEMGSSLNRALAAIAAQMRDADMARVVRRVLADVEEGMPLSAALQAHRRVFDPVFVSMVRAGESAGILPAMLARQAELLRRRRQFRAALRGSLSYPLFLVGLSILVVGFMLGVIFPRFAAILADVHAELPWLTRALLAGSAILRQHAVWIGAGALAAALGLRAAAATEPGRARLEAVPLRLPGVRGLVREAYAGRLLLNLGTLLASRVPLLEAVAITEGLLPRRLYGRFFAELRASVESGRGLAAAFAASDHFPPTVQEMIQTGESSSGLDRIMLRLSEFYEDETRERLRAFLGILEPVLLVLMGIVVAGISLSLLVPILRLSGSMR